MSNLPALLWLIPALPLAAAVLVACLGPRFLREYSHWPTVLACAGSCVLSVLVLFTVMGSHGEEQDYYAYIHPGETTSHIGEVKTYYTWFQAGTVDVGFTLRADGLAAVMLVTVTFIGTLIALFASGYMHGDPGYPRFFAEVALFIFSMTGLVLANNLLLLYAFWEGVGLCSFLLIGFWFTKPSAANAARKAFLVTRLGDVGFLLGILLVWYESGWALDFESIMTHSNVMGMQADGVLTWACLLLFCGAVGKSAQFPLYVWLPDAMEGPTPVSALIHAATMVTAGVYLVARCNPLFAAAPDAQLVVACIGGFTALLAALIALTQTDLKRVLAYSTISQLGYMFLALGTGFGVVAAIFHLFTHAFFKALLFLAAGSVMHAMGGVIDMRRFGGLRKVMPVTHGTFLVGALALAGVPPLAGFWSKDEILGSVFFAGTSSLSHDHWLYLLLYVVGSLTALLTAFYTFRAYFLTFQGEERIPHEAGHHAHESPPTMTIPLIVLAVGAALAGVVGPTHWLHHTLVEHTVGFKFVEPETSFLVMGLSVLLALLGVGVAYWMYVREPGLPPRLAGSMRVLYQASLNKFYVDELYYLGIVKPWEGFAMFCRWIDQYVIDTIVDMVGEVPRLMGALLRPVQNGLVQFYALAMILGLAVFLLALVMR